MIDLRSDTVTRPSPGMRRAIAEAEVGDDVLERDPTTQRLEERVAELLGKEDALFFPSGSQANAAALGLLTRPGTELLVEAQAHMVDREVAGLAQLTGVQARPIATPDGILTADLIRVAMRPDSIHLPRPSAIAIENTHNTAGGKVMLLPVAEAIGALARERGLPLHLDGARLWNAAAALGVRPADVARPALTVMVSFSKALGCPVGAVLACPASARRDVWEIRKRLGGGMRQSGILAAAALYALDHNLDRIPEDHANARRLAAALGGHPAVRPLSPETNIVMLDLLRAQDAPDAVAARLGAQGVMVSPWGARRLRAVTHLDVSAADIDRAAAVIARVLG
ncbi:MAG TPA: GntG family PLP-dependent aldolase [Gemmatimonadales bacterium]|jgi:threonine aldolase